MRALVLALSIAALTLGACCPEPNPGAKAKGTESAAPAPATLAVVALEAGAMVAPTAAGQKLDPAVSKAQIPAGAWFCDMGTVHFARADRGDGTCPVCHMKLVENQR